MLLCGPSGCRQFAPLTNFHQSSGLSRGIESEGGEKTTEPGTKSAGATSGNSFGLSGRSATVTYPVAFTNRANCSFVTSVSSIQKPPTATSWTGCASSMWSLPIENRPPEIHTMPRGSLRVAGDFADSPTVSPSCRRTLAVRNECREMPASHCCDFFSAIVEDWSCPATNRQRATPTTPKYSEVKNKLLADIRVAYFPEPGVWLLAT